MSMVKKYYKNNEQNTNQNFLNIKNSSNAGIVVDLSL